MNSAFQLPNLPCMTYFPAKFVTGILLIFLNLSAGFSQSTAPPSLPSLEFNTFYGFLIRHHLDMGRYTNIRFPSWELAVSRQTDGSKTWHRDHHFPVQGLSVMYSGLGQTSELGDVWAVIPWLKIPVIRSGSLAVHFQFGTGAGYFQKKFDVLENYKNRAIGSHLNACIQFGLSLQYPVYRNLLLTGGFRWIHFSNGSIKIPNYGINMPSLFAGLLLQPGRHRNTPEISQRTEEIRNPELRISYFHGTKQILPLNGPRYQVSVLSASCAWPFRRNGSMRSGLDFSVDQSDKALLRDEGRETSSAAELLKTGLFGGISSRFGRTTVYFDAGVYLSGKETSDGAVYDRLGLQVQLTRGLSTGIYLKSHYAKADFIGWGLSYTVKEFRR